VDKRVTIPETTTEAIGSGAGFLQLDAVSKRYGDKTVVRDVSLAVDAGEVLTILGPSGCGKTTTLKIIAGFLAADGGSVRIGGRAVERLTSHQRGAAMVFQNYALFPHMTVRRNVAFGLRMRRQPKDEIAREVAAMLDRVRLSDFAERFPKELSGGQQQRVALARALIVRPNILLLDEPFSSLDAKLRKQLRAEFLEIHRSFRITSVFVTHDLEEAFAISDKVAVMNGGVVEQVGAPSAIFARPQSRFVADFVGHRNILSGTAERAAGGRRLPVAGGPALALADDGPVGPVTLSIPVHRIRIGPGAEACDTRLEAIVGDVGFLGPVVQVTLQAGPLRLESYATGTDATEALRPGDRVAIGWNAADLIEIPGGAG